MKHLEYDERLYEPKDYHDSILRLLKIVQKIKKKSRNQVRLIDVGSGHGTLMRRLQEEGYREVLGIDIDKNCVELSNRYGICFQADVDEIDSVITERCDVAILAHVIEHLENPRASIEKLKNICELMIIIVPNPSRMKVLLKHNLLSRDYSNKGHYYSWDRSHFTNFLEAYCNLDIIRWEPDRVQVIFLSCFRNLLRLVGVLDRLEAYILTRVLPYFANSHIVLCRCRCDRHDVGEGK